MTVFPPPGARNWAARSMVTRVFPASRRQEERMDDILRKTLDFIYALRYI